MLNEINRFPTTNILAPLEMLARNGSLMLIVTGRQTETISLGKDITLTIVKVNGEKVRIGVDAPPHLKVLRAELEIDASSHQQTIPFPTVPVSDIARFRKAA